MFESERWKSIMNHPVHTNLEPLLLELPDFCLQSKAVNTRRFYEGAFNKWCKWCVPYNISTLPASDVNVSLYLMHLSKFKKFISTINSKQMKKKILSYRIIRIKRIFLKFIDVLLTNSLTSK